MGFPEHVSWLLEGVNSWNERRRQEKFVPYLSDEDLSTKLLAAGIMDSDGKPNLSRINLSDAWLSGCNLEDVKFWHANLSGANLSGSILEGASLIAADLSHTNLGKANISTAQLALADLAGADLEDCILDGAHIGDANLVGARLTRSRPWRANIWSNDDPRWHESQISLIGGISRVDDLLQSINTLKTYYASIREGHEVTIFYFRGESEDSWDLRPSVMRTLEGADDSLREVEARMLVELQTQRAEDFVESTSALEQMVISQHHGLPTRLLDVTRNPLVALYHATREGRKPTKNGQIHIFAVPESMVKPFNSDTVTVVANFARLRRGEQNLLLGKKSEDTEGDAYPKAGNLQQTILGNPYVLAMNRLYQFIRLERPSFAERIDPKDFLRILIVEPQQSSERVRAQSGAFLLSAFHEVFDEQTITELYPTLPIYHHYTLTVAGISKIPIAEDLATLNVTDETMFPSLDQTATAIRRNHRDRQIQVYSDKT